MRLSELNAIVSALTIVIEENVPDVDDLAILAISINQLGDNLKSIVAQRILVNKHKDL
ncbi:DUF6774 domain-containing protein [Sinanaerobacter chloroacetimidivorans]|uniref:DUF6774 domain-containing protein n=1 Tax=Sinanaerobacter chloroacetimidivorans TaxID=2818044 RepID=A0A8J7W708_9FIRM|nr:DUF6774 domain-containing protein [Sinanaerobacter chloroacetimidivorans]MBR0600478.1 hypothetical protein [Sinanaerobacter chloroacetimidivorans]